ncbi:MAG: 6-phosphogluconolactonase [Variovorax sp.]|nr:MAG: 6-phosphogluconolactonase [Variovorax sp.]
MNSTDIGRPSGVRERRYATADELVAALADDIALHLNQAIGERGVASLVVSGGRTPIPLFRALRSQDIDWSRVQITLADERWVDPSDPESNEGLVRRELLVDRAASARFVPLKTSAPTPQQGAAAAWAGVATLAQPFDYVVLGMGDDGHTASLFPGSPGVLAALDPRGRPACVAMSSPAPPNARLSLNLPAIAHNRRAVVHLTGDKKWEIYRDAARRAVEAERAAAGAVVPELPPIAAMLRLRPRAPQVWWSP